MRLSICFRRADSLHRLVWLSEDRTGVYWGVRGGEPSENHTTYHDDGMRHIKLGRRRIFPFSGVPIANVRGVKQLQHLSLSLSKAWFTSATAYRGDAKSETVLVLSEGLFEGQDTCALDVWLFDRRSESLFYETTKKRLKPMSGFALLAEVVEELDNFSDHKIALTVFAARIRAGVPPGPSDLSG